MKSRSISFIIPVQFTSWLPVRSAEERTRPAIVSSQVLPGLSSSLMKIYMYYIHPEIRMGNYHSGMGREQGRFERSTEEAGGRVREQGGTI